MGDLIDLNTPNMKKLLDPKLASPLIPVPTDIETNEQPNKVTEKQDCLDSNPFDKILNETTEYISKKGDPFEVMLQRALKFKNNIREDNKLDSKHVSEQDYKIIVTDINSVDLSILNQSTMNDTLLEEVPKDKEGDEVLYHEKEASFKNLVLPGSMNFKSHTGLLRTLSQEDRKLSPRQSQCLSRSQSATDSLIISQSDNTALSFFNKGFLESRQSEQSVFSGLSDVSSIRKMSSTSIASNFSLMSSSNTMNRAFLNTDGSSLKTSIEEINTSERSAEIKSVQYDMSDLTERLNKLKSTIDGTTSTLNTMEEVKSNFIKEEAEKKNTKLIDVDIFMPEPHFYHNKSSISTSSSDSVFIDDNKLNKSIWNEAKTLARTFEELALKTDSESTSMDDLISNNTSWMSELVPAFEDDVVGNLIELPISPKVDVKDAVEDDSKQSFASTDNSDENCMKETKPQSTDCTFITRQTMVTTLLLDLKKLVKTENNPEASNLIDNLENVLGVKYKNNIELLASLSMSNELRTVEMSDNKSNNTEQSNNTNSNKSQEENKIFSQDKICNSESSLLHLSHKLEDTSQVTTVSSDILLTKTSSCNCNNGTYSDITDSTQITSISNCSKKEDSSSDEKLALVLLDNLRKLLSDQAEAVTTSHLLKSIGKALNITSSKIEENALQTNDKSHNSQQVTSVKILESEYGAHPSALTKTLHERNFNSRSKSLEQMNRRSIATNSSNSKTSNTQAYKRKSTSEFKDFKKRFSSDPGIIHTLTSKKITIPEVACSIKTMAETVERETKKEKVLGMVEVKNMLKKKSNVVSKKGPIKAMHPVGAVQRRVSVGKQTAVSYHITTPPKSNGSSSGNKIISSTPNSMDNHISKKVIKTKPVASSTPDGQNGRTRMQLTSTNKKRNISCDISPVTTYVDVDVDQKSSPVRSSKLPTPKKCTPKRQQADSNSSNIPKYYTPPRKFNSSLDMNHPSKSLLESPQYLNKSVTGIYRYSPVRTKTNTERILLSPFKESNKITPKVKPLKLISKLKGHTVDVAEKENYIEK